MIGRLTPRRAAQAGICALALASLTAAWPATASTVHASTSLSVKGQLNGIAAVSASEAWAVGWAGSITSQHLLILHWNGSTWR